MNLLQAAGIDPADATGWAQLAIFLTTVAGFLFQAYRENRNHKWETQRRKEEAADTEAHRVALAREVEAEVERLAKEVEAEVERRAREVEVEVERRAREVEAEAARLALDVKAEVEHRAEQIKNESKAHNAGVQAAIQKNTVINERALGAANTFNAKLHTALEKLDAARIETRASAEAAAAIVEVAREAASVLAADRVGHIEQVVVDNNDQIRQAREDLEALGKA